MKRMAPKMVGAFAVLLLFLAAAAPTGAQSADALAARGKAIANADPLSAELRKRQPDDASRRGFDIGIAAAEGHTLPGPGKQKIHDSLPPNEQGGFNIAVAFSLERNRNKDFAAKGAAIAKLDKKVAAARTAEADVFYWLGFDIATGIFGNPALGAKGNTAIGPGSLKIRDSLSAAGQIGFNASVKLHLGQAPPPSSPEQLPKTPGQVTSIDSSAVASDRFGKRSKALDAVYGGWKCNEGSAPRIVNPEARVEVNRAYISFTSPPNASPYVELSRVEPVVTPGGCLGFPSGKAIGAWPVPRITDGGLFFIYLEKYTRLEPGTKYHYVINNPDVNVSIDAKQSNSRAQESGSFTTINTLTQTVKVVFTNMYVLSDSDPDSAGDLGFNFGARKRDGSFNWRSSGLDQWESGDKRRIQQEIVIENAPDLLFLVVEGYDNDSTTDNFPRNADTHTREYKKGPGEIKGINGMEWNVAIGQFDLTAYSGMTATEHFTLQSMPLGRNTGDLVFQVSGYFEVTRH